MANPTGWDSSWGEYKAGTNDFSTQIASGNTAAVSARQDYLNSQGGSITGSNGQTYSANESVESITNRVNGSSNSGNKSSYTPTPAGNTPTPTHQTQNTQSNGYTYNNNILSLGSTGNDVKNLQNALIAAGYDVGKDGADGIYGQNTYNAVKQYQKDNGLNDDGVVGIKTGTALSGGFNTSNTNTSAVDTQARDQGWNSAWNQYGSSNNMMQAAQNAYAAGDYLAAAQIEQARNNYLASTGNTQYQQTTTYGAVETKRRYNSATNESITTYSYRDASGNVHEVATVNNSALPNGYSYSDTTYDGDGNVWEVTYQWNQDGQGVGTGSWTESYQLVTQRAPQQGYGDLVGYLESMYSDYLDAALNKNNAATEMSVNEIKAQLENGLQQYETAASEAYLTYVKNSDAMAMQNAAVGNTGGIAQRQYSDQQAAYDAQLLAIALERQNFINTCNQTIAQLEAQGRYNEATILADWAKEKIAAITQAYEWTYEMAYKYDALELDREQQNMQRVLTLLNLGVSTADAAQQLGISQADVEYIKDQYRQQIEASINGGSGNNGGDPARVVEEETDINKILYNAGCKDYQSAYNYLTTVMKKSDDIADNIASAYEENGYDRIRELEQANSTIDSFWTSGYKNITNKVDTNRRTILVNPYGELTLQQLSILLQTGEVEEVRNGGKISYFYRG